MSGSNSILAHRPADVAPVAAALADAVPTWALAALGGGSLALAGGRAGVALLVWVAPVPWLLWARRARGWRGWLVLFAALAAAHLVQLATIITPPVPWAMAPAFALPVAASMGAVVLATELLRRRTSERWAIVGFASLCALGDVASGASPVGAWGTTAGHLPDDLVILQLASVLGVGGIGGLTAAVAAWLAAALASERPGRLLPEGAVVGGALAAAAVFGTWRLAGRSDAPTVPVAAVVTDVGLSSDGLPDAGTLRAGVDELFARSAAAADRGARLVVWNEGATAVTTAEERGLVERGAAFAREHRVDLVLAYIVVTQERPLRFLNQAVFVGDDGAVLATYHKRHPVPGETEPSDNGVPRLVRPYGVVSLAICYDHDFPEMSRRHAAAGADLVALPSSDWAGIDPVHTAMARARAIEGGFSTLRATRSGPSAGFDPWGRARGWMRVDEDNGRVLVVDLPLRRVETVYARVGDAPMLAPLVVLAAWLVRATRRR